MQVGGCQPGVRELADHYVNHTVSGPSWVRRVSQTPAILVRALVSWVFNGGSCVDGGLEFRKIKPWKAVNMAGERKFGRVHHISHGYVNSFLARQPHISPFSTVFRGRHTGKDC